MNTIEAIYKRRSIRNYLDIPVEKDKIMTLLKAATAATSLGLGSVWIGVYPLESNIKPLKKILNIPEYVMPLGIMYVGYAAEEKEPRTRLDEKRVYWQAYDPNRKHRAKDKPVIGHY